MALRGWVYVMSNKAMPNLIKVGFSTKDPELRANELGKGNTGVPHPYNVIYDVLVQDPYQIEQQVHSKLSDKNEAKEWFRCSAIEAIKAIREVAGAGLILENIRIKLEPETDEQGDIEAVKRFLKAAEQGQASAQSQLGWMYFLGRGVEQDDELAVVWFLKATEQGHAAAQFGLGTMYSEGRGVEQDDELAVLWYRKAAEQGHANAQKNLDIMFKKRNRWWRFNAG